MSHEQRKRRNYTEIVQANIILHEISQESNLLLPLILSIKCFNPNPPRFFSSKTSRKAQLLELSKTSEVTQSEGAVLTYLLLDENLDDFEVLANVLELLVGGVDTTSNTIVWMLYELARHPEVLRQLEEEIDRVLGADVKPSVKLVHKMPFLKKCVKESLRIFPVAPTPARRLESDLELDGYLVPKGTVVSCVYTYMALSERYFEEPRKFDPDRWDRAVGMDFHPFSALPFG